MIGFLHVNKCGGSHLYKYLYTSKKVDKYFGHNQTLEQSLRICEKVVVPLRDPVSRYISALEHLSRDGVIDPMNFSIEKTFKMHHCRKNYSAFMNLDQINSNKGRIFTVSYNLNNKTNKIFLFRYLRILLSGINSQLKTVRSQSSIQMDGKDLAIIKKHLTQDIRIYESLKKCPHLD